MKQPDLARCADFVWRNARLLDRYRFAHHFLGGSAEPVLTALRGYQNADGGFGNALEPDLRAPLSQPQPVEVALRILTRMEAMGDPMVRSACDYLTSITTPAGGVPFVLAAASEYPCAPWWRAEGEQPASLNPTAALAGLLHRTGVEHPWLKAATDFCWRALEAPGGLGGYDLVAVLTFLEHVPQRDRAERAFGAVAERVLAEVNLDPYAEGHVFTPLNFAPHPGALARRLFDDAVIEAHLNALIERQESDGGWPITWDAPSPAAELEWRGSLAVDTPLQLRAYSRI
jgi:hypothetical protein